MIVLSDGSSVDTEGITAAMEKISAADIQTFVIGVGELSKKPESRCAKHLSSNGVYCIKKGGYDVDQDGTMTQGRVKAIKVFIDSMRKSHAQ